MEGHIQSSNSARPVIHMGHSMNIFSGLAKTHLSQLRDFDRHFASLRWHCASTLKTTRGGERTAGIYIIRNNLLMKFYVGQSVAIETRLPWHFFSGGYQTNHALHQDVKRQGRHTFSVACPFSGITKRTLRENVEGYITAHLAHRFGRSSVYSMSAADYFFRSLERAESHKANANKAYFYLPKTIHDKLTQAVLNSKKSRSSFVISALRDYLKN